VASIHTWTFLAGLGLFLYGISLMEKVTKLVAGRSFKLFLQRATKNPIKAILGGTIITGIIQSSSVVILMLMSFVESGIISFQNALAVLIGSNLGTTVDSWFIAAVGFKFNIQSYALPVIAITAIAMFFTEKRIKLYDTLNFIFAIGILLFGFSLMKDGAGQLVLKFHLAEYNHYNLIVILFVGFILTVLIQSSSATVAIALTALYTHALSFPAAACIIIGSETGTTIKFLVSSIKGGAEKRMLAWGDFIFNLFTTIIAFSALPLIVYFITKIVGIGDPMIALVFFQSFINLVSIIIFAPFIRPFSNWLAKRFQSGNPAGRNNFYLNLSAKNGPAPETLQKAAFDMLQRVIGFHNKIFGRSLNGESNSLLQQIKSYTRVHGTTDEEYLLIKETEGNILKFHCSLQKDGLSEPDNEKIRNCLASIRQSIHAAKSVHDIRHNLQVFNSSANNILFFQNSLLQEEWQTFSAHFSELMHQGRREDLSGELEKLMRLATGQFKQHEDAIEEFLTNGELNEVESSTLLNVYQECLSSKKALLRSLALLDLEQPGSFIYLDKSLY
jgi:phosphate:Na+ symporter